jgi:hypothetical protein
VPVIGTWQVDEAGKKLVKVTYDAWWVVQCPSYQLHDGYDSE